MSRDVAASVSLVSMLPAFLKYVLGHYACDSVITVQVKLRQRSNHRQVEAILIVCGLSDDERAAILALMKTRELSGKMQPDVLPGQLDVIDPAAAAKFDKACVGLKCKDVEFAKGGEDSGCSASEASTDAESEGEPAPAVAAEKKKKAEGLMLVFLHCFRLFLSLP